MQGTNPKTTPNPSAIAKLQPEIERIDRPSDIQPDLTAMIQRASTLQISEKEMAILHEPISDFMVQIRSHDGIPYMPWIEHHKRLMKAFGTEWSLVPDGLPRMQKGADYVLWGHYFLIKGIFVAYIIGEQRYIANNPQMTWSDAAEGAYSNTLTRAGKRLGIGLELWDKNFIERWKKEWAYTTQEKDWKTGKMKTVWKRKQIASQDAGAPEEKPSDPEPETQNGKGNGNGYAQMDSDAIENAYYKMRREVFGNDDDRAKEFQQGLKDKNYVRSATSTAWNPNEFRNGLKYLEEYRDSDAVTATQQIAALLNTLEGEGVDREMLELYVKMRFLVPEYKIAPADVIGYLHTAALPQNREKLDIAIANTLGWWNSIPEGDQSDVMCCITDLNNAYLTAGEADEMGEKVIAAFFESNGVQMVDELYMLYHLTYVQLADYRAKLESVCSELGVEFSCGDIVF